MRQFWLEVILVLSIGLCCGYHLGRWNKPPELWIIPMPVPCKCESVNI